jgi:DNA polymerase III delta prime subunit
MLIVDKYKPTTQKSLFHKDVVNHIRKWIKTIEDYADNNKSVQQILFLYGPIGCSKTVTVECLFKSYNLINVDSDNLRSSDKISETLQSIVGFREVTLANIDKWNHKNRKDRSNIVFIDNLELCDRGIEGFIESLHIKHKINIPIILVCNSSKYKDIISNHTNCTFLEFKRPSLLELTKLSTEIITKESLGLTKDQIKQIIEKSEYDIRQLLFIIQQWSLSKMSGCVFNNFIENIQIKNTDKDLYEKLEYLFDNDKDFKISDVFLLASSEPLQISNSIYQNYPNIPQECNLSKIENIKVLEQCSRIMDSLSDSNLIHNEIYENQNWCLYNDYTINSSVIPSYHIKEKNKILFENFLRNKNDKEDDKEDDKGDEMDIDQTPSEGTLSENELREWKNKLYDFSQYKDISYNFLNSYQEVKRITSANMFSRVLNPSSNAKHSHTISDPFSCFTMVKIFIRCIDDLNEYFNKNKRGKNTTKKEKLELCENISSGPAKISLDILVNNIYEYKLFEIDTDDFLINRSKYKDNAVLKENVNKVDIRVFKRLLNIFTMDDKHKTFKSHIETSVQYKILQRLVNEYDDEPTKISFNIENILTEDLNKIWNLS